METPTYIVLGATGGTGSELSRLLTASGYRVALVGRNAPALTELAGELSSETFEIDASDTDAVEQVARKVLEQKAKSDERFARRFAEIVEKHDKNLYGA